MVLILVVNFSMIGIVHLRCCLDHSFLLFDCVPLDHGHQLRYIIGPGRNFPFLGSCLAHSCLLFDCVPLAHEDECSLRYIIDPGRVLSYNNSALLSYNNSEKERDK